MADGVTKRSNSLRVGFASEKLVSERRAFDDLNVLLANGKASKRTNVCEYYPEVSVWWHS